MKKLIPTVFALFALGCIVGHCVACAATPHVVENVENAAAVAQYEALLDECRKAGKAAGSYEVYERCADSVDLHLCAERGLRCKEGP